MQENTNILQLKDFFYGEVVRDWWGVFQNTYKNIAGRNTSFLSVLIFPQYTITFIDTFVKHTVYTRV